MKHEHFEANIVHVVEQDDDIKHYVICEQDVSFDFVGSQMSFFIDKERRLLNARYHTAAHLLGNIVETLYPSLKAIKGHSFPGEAYVEFHGPETIDDLALQVAINEVIVKNHTTMVFDIDPKTFEETFYKLPYTIPDHKKFRAIQIGDMPPVPCGGTHLNTISEIDTMTISKIKHKNNTVRVSYKII
jgi:alanyl-tRNA synthetase